MIGLQNLSGLHASFLCKISLLGKYLFYFAHLLNRIDKRIEDKKEKIEEIKLVVSGFEERKAEIENFIAIHYEEDDGKWIIKEEYYDRTDEKLLIPFQSGGLLENEKSPDVLLRKQEEIKLLEIIRKEVSWQ